MAFNNNYSRHRKTYGGTGLLNVSFKSAVHPCVSFQILINNGLSSFLSQTTREIGI